jgi:hypothetical protein
MGKNMGGLPKKRKSKMERLAEEVAYYMRMKNSYRLSKIILRMRRDELIKLSLYYKHLRKGGDKFCGKKCLYDDIEKSFSNKKYNKFRETILGFLKKELSIKTNIKHDEIIFHSDLARAKIIWPMSQREEARRLLKKPNNWPKGFRNDLQGQLQKIGFWLIDNYDFIMTSPDADVLGFKFIPTGDNRAFIRSLSVYRNRFNDNINRVFNNCNKGITFGPFPGPKWMKNNPEKCEESLIKCKNVFCKSKGKLSEEYCGIIKMHMRKISRWKKMSSF